MKVIGQEREVSFSVQVGRQAVTITVNIAIIVGEGLCILAKSALKKASALNAIEIQNCWWCQNLSQWTKPKQERYKVGEIDTSP